MKSERLPELINGWFIVAFSRDVPRGAVRVVHYMDQTVALFRTASGRLAAVDGFCPHLGAAFENMGTVVGEELRCGAHGFRFDCAGACTHAYGNPLATARLRTWHVREQLDAIFLWYHHEGAAPTWELPSLAEPGWSAGHPTKFSIRSHPQFVVENGIDLGHFRTIHGFSDAETGRLTIDGHHLRLDSSFSTPPTMIGSRDPVHVTLKYDVLGLGLGIVDTQVPSIGAHMRTYVAPVPVGDGTVDIRCWVSLREPAEIAARIPVIGRFLPKLVAVPVMESLMHLVFLYDFRKDLRYMDKRRYVSPPSLARSEVHIGPYRKWARQFYAPSASTRPSLPVLVA